jgi:hypothetical protein
VAGSLYVAIAIEPDGKTQKMLLSGEMKPHSYQLCEAQCLVRFAVLARRNRFNYCEFDNLLHV